MAEIAKNVIRPVRLSEGEFKKLPRDKQRTLILCDILGYSLKSDKVRINQGRYFYAEFNEEERRFSPRGNTYLSGKKVLGTPKVTCEVCAKGAMLISRLRLNGDFNLYTDNGTTAYANYDNDLLENYFYEDELDSIESLFELDTYGNYNQIPEEDIDRYCAYIEHITPSEFLLTDVSLEQIVRNFLYNDGIDLSNHPHHSRKLTLDRETLTVSFEEGKVINILEEYEVGTYV